MQPLLNYSVIKIVGTITANNSKVSSTDLDKLEVIMLDIF